MTKKMAAITLIFCALGVAWFVLAGSLSHRTWTADRDLSAEVSGLWGAPQTQLSPEAEFVWTETVEERENVKDPASGTVRVITREKRRERRIPVILDKSDIGVALTLDHRKKGLLWYATYGVAFDGSFAYRHDEAREGRLVITYRFPTVQASYDGFRFSIDGKEDPKLVPVSADGTKIVVRSVPVRPGQDVAFDIAYATRGLDHWRYSFGQDVNRVKNFSLVVRTDFHDIDFSDGSISPSTNTQEDDGWRLAWTSENLISGFSIGIEMPKKLNPGPLAARISVFAPVSLGFFFVWMFVITLMRDIRLHPMNYLFLGAAFFAFHLLFAYTVDHIDVRIAFALASAVSVFLVVSYMRLVVGARFAAVEVGTSQLVYLVLFSLAHFLEGLTGLTVTIGSIMTLFALMQLTGRVDWSEKLAGMSRAAASTAAVSLVVLAVTGAGCRVEPESPLGLAAWRGDDALVEPLLASGAEIDRLEADGMTPRALAARHGHASTIRVLVEGGADPNRPAVHDGRQRAVRALLDTGANAAGPGGTRALFMAAGYGDAGSTRMLLAAGP